MASERVRQILSEVASGHPRDEDLLPRLLAICAGRLPVSGVGVMLMTDDGPAGTVAATDAATAALEELQFTLGEGPCVESSSTGRPVLVPDVSAAGVDRWPGYAERVLDAGCAAVFALPLRVGGIRLGVMDLYRTSPGALSAAELAEALAHADAATSILLHLQANLTARVAARPRSPLDEAGAADEPEGGRPGGLGDDHDTLAVPVLDERAEVHQATGVVAVQAGVGLAAALVLLRARAFASERAIGDVARDVLDGVLVFDDHDPPGAGPG